MSWTDPRTWTAAELVTAAKMNEIRDSLRASGGARTTTTPTLTDESEWCYPADTTNGVVWRFKYNSGSGSAYKWEFVGGPPMFAAVATDESTASGSYVDLATVGPSVTVPRAGDYLVEWSEAAYNATGGVVMYAAVKRGAAATSDNDACTHGPDSSTSPGGTRSRKIVVTGLAASDVIKIQYKTSGGTAHFLNRHLFVTPIRVS